MSKEVAISIRGLSKKYELKELVGESESVSRELWALKDVEVDIHTGEAVGIIGVNGSGKSTLLKIISGISKPSEGTVEITGRVASILGIGAGFHPDLSGYENIFLHAQILGFSNSEIKIKLPAILEFSGIEKFIHEPVKNYSDGMYLRLAFSIMAELQADIYLFDEVISVGDTKFQRKCLKRLSELVISGKTVVIVSHDLNQVQQFLDTVIELADGRVENYGPAKAKIEEYMDRSLEDEIHEEFTRPNPNKIVWNKDEWPGIPSMRILEFELKQENCDQWRTDRPLVARIKIRTANELPKCEVAICVADVMGNVVLIDSPDVINNRPDLFDNPGEYELTFEFPANTLNQRTHCIGIMMGNEEGRSVYRQTNLFVMDMKGPERKGALAGNSGVLNPFLKWNINR